MRCQRTILLISLFLVLVSSCAKLNDDYPPVPWQTYFYKSKNIAPRPVTVIFYEDEQRQWLGAQQQQGLLFNNGKQWITYDAQNIGINLDSVSCVVRDGNDKVWVGWKSGLAVFDGQKWTKIPQFDGRNVSSIAVEGIENLWVGINGSASSGGLAYFENRAWVFYNLSNSGIPSSKIQKLLLDASQRLWVCSADKGVFNFQNGIWKSFDFTQPAIPSSNFKSICLDGDQKVWAGSVTSQLVCFTNNSLSLILKTGTPAPITSLVADAQNNIWCSTYGAGLLKLSNGKWSSLTAQNARLPSDTILCMAEGPNGTILFSLMNSMILSVNNRIP